MTTGSPLTDLFNIDEHHPVVVIAELSANHNGSLDTALTTIKAAKRAGADAIKLQTYTPDTITLDARTDDFRLKQGTVWDGKYLYDLYKEACTPWEWHARLFDAAHAEGIACISSPFDETAVDLLEDLHVPAYKIASFEITHIPLIEYVASKGKPVIISTGIAGENDIELALDACKRMGNGRIILLKCTSSYPAPIHEANMRMIREYSNRFGVTVGLSDHTPGITVPIVAVCFGAGVIEKHFILDRSMGGPDASFSLNEAEFAEMVRAIREAEAAIGHVDYVLTESQRKARELSRSLYVAKDMKAGEVISQENVRVVRPGYGLHPKYYRELLGKRVKADLAFGTPLRPEDILEFIP
jgi:pseudaminic acid synthase